MNIVSLLGRLVRDPDVRYTQNQMAVARFTVAVDRSMTKQRKEQAQNTGAPTADFISCQAFDKTAETIGKYFTKGRKIAIVGHIQTGQYQNKQGATVYTTDVIVDRFYFPDSASQQNQQGNQQHYQQNQQQYNQQPVQYAPQQNYQQPPVQYQPPQQPPVQPPAQQQISMDDELPSGFIENDEDDIPF